MSCPSLSTQNCHGTKLLVMLRRPLGRIHECGDCNGYPTPRRNVHRVPKIHEIVTFVTKTCLKSKIPRQPPTYAGLYSRAFRILKPWASASSRPASFPRICSIPRELVHRTVFDHRYSAPAPARLRHLRRAQPCLFTLACSTLSRDRVS